MKKSIDNDMSRRTWNLAYLRSRVDFLYGENQLKLLSPCLESVVTREYYARFHYQEGRDLVYEFLSTRGDVKELVGLVFGGVEEDQVEFNRRCRFAEAHVVACLQNIHSAYDIMGHVVYFSLGMNNIPDQKIPEHKIGIKSVYNKIRNIDIYSNIVNEIDKYINNDNYKYLSAIVNNSKHRSIINICFTVDIGDDEKDLYKFNFNEFVYNRENYVPRCAYTFIDEEYNRCSSQIVSIGLKLNDYLCDVGD
ncbi:MAG: hypothetical protein KUA37_02055 [Desulfomicrobium sp.]|nr:hypothetical protein [Pseudomonadota bacterium]MBV1710775.1 hypothetical protein [Desulfomicrobium sp.]MBU4570383.1 hypothetical protein [Pseudomonadota bacterium]MBU4593304.1 hypothetical protein [Pseudomonadota bacterium]MBV1721566.1 hypothetical protein [Desulfomicrobium sp.]